MKIIVGILLYFISIVHVILAQPNNDIVILEEHYKSFEYSTAISKANDLLLDKERFSDQNLIEIYTVKAASYFAMGDQTNTRKTFVDLLKINVDYNLDNVMYSPKLIGLFNEVKLEFLDILSAKEEKQNPKIRIENENLIKEPIYTRMEFNIALAKSLVLPGLGHLQFNNDTKSWILTCAGTANLTSMLYFIFDTNSKEKVYLEETNAKLIQTKYNQYNSSYKIRNVLIVTYAAIWLYSQLDLLFFSNNLESKNISLQNQIDFKSIVDENILLSFRIAF